MTDAIVTKSKNEIAMQLPNKFVFICFASFEKRSTISATAIPRDRISKTIAFRSINVANEDAVETICSKLSDVQIIEIELRNPISVAQDMTTCVKELISAGNQSLVVDVTTFTHESLAMLIKLLYDNQKAFTTIHFLYNGAFDYSDSKTDGLKQMWLSKGCRDVRNVIGYPGMMRPALKTCLVLLTGFELERATGLIEILEPDRLMLGIGTEPTHENNQEAMDYFRKKFTEWESNYKNSNYSNFEFSCKNISSAIVSIENVVASNPDENYIVVPLNTKLSTIAAAIVALRNKKIQICYPLPEIYNTKNYSIPSDTITVFDLYSSGVFN
jgi:hypothetical protein